MSDLDRKNPPRWQWFFAGLALAWTLVVTGSLVWEFTQERAHLRRSALIQAKEAFDKDVIYRRWNAMHGGVYVPVTTDVQPNPYLEEWPERDLITPSGRQLTLINPAYMTRQVHELAEEVFGFIGHITSLDPIRPENAPDSWEKAALLAFEQGEEEVSSMKVMNGQEYLRMMRPLITEQGCLDCHAAQGYQLGDIRGGISVAVPVQPFDELAQQNIVSLLLGHGIIYLLGMLGIALSRRSTMNYERQRRAAEAALQQAYTEQAQAESALRESAAQIEAANRELSDFAHIVSHDLKAPLRGVSQLSGWISNDYMEILDEDGQKKLDLLIGQTKHMHKLIDGILQYSRVGRVEAVERRVDLNQLVQETIELLAPPKNIRISVLNELPTIVGVRTYFEQVFQNLLSNAVNYMDKAEGFVRIGCVEEEDEWQFSIADNGPGIEEKYFDKIFQIFQTLAPRTEVESTGIGLTLVKKAVEAWGGRIWVEPKVGEGSTFFFTVPKKGESNERA